MNKQNPSPPTSSVGAAASDAPATVRSITRWLKVLALLMVGPWILLGLHVLPRDDADTGGPSAAPGSTAGKPPTRSEYGVTGRGPWGRSSYVPITISPPPEFMRHMMPLPGENLAWHFPNTISARLPALLSETGLSESLREKLASLAEPNPAVEGLTVRPTREIVLGLSPEDRSALYAILAGFRENVSQVDAFRFQGSSLDEWLGDAPLSPETRKLIEPLVYRYGSFLSFADLPAIEELLPSPEQRSLLIETLSHQSAFLVRLELSEESNLEELIDYWGRGGRTKDVRAILGSLLHTGGQQSVDIAYLLPPFARLRLYTYEAFSAEKSRHLRNCHWSALNFFSDQPDDRYCDIDEVVRALKEDHYVIYSNLRLGDLVAFFDDQMRLAHTAVFIADDVLFTKNGPASHHPWMFIKLESMKYYYPDRNGLQVRYFRRKDL